MLEAFILIVVLAAAVILILFFVLNRQNKDYPYHGPSTYFEQNTPSDISIKSQTISYEDVVRSIKHRFQPSLVDTEKEYEKQLMQFIQKTYPSISINKGHSSRGIQIDFVIEGTIALELILADTEGRLVSVVSQMMESKQDYGNRLVVVIDNGLVKSAIIERYIDQYTELGITPILKKV